MAVPPATNQTYDLGADRAKILTAEPIRPGHAAAPAGLETARASARPLGIIVAQHQDEAPVLLTVALPHPRPYAPEPAGVLGDCRASGAEQRSTPSSEIPDVGHDPGRMSYR